MSDAALLVPPVRLGRLLRNRRVDRSLSLTELSREPGGLSIALLEDIEQGRAPLDEQTIAVVASLYDIDANALAPQRSELIIDLEEGLLSLGEHRSVIANSPSDQVLAKYLAIVYALRDLPNGSEIPIRQLDVGVLAHALEAERSAVEDELNSLMTEQTNVVEAVGAKIRRRLVVPIAGIFVGLTAVGGLVLVAAEPQPATSEEIPLDIGDAVMIANPGAEQVGR